MLVLVVDVPGEPSRRVRCDRPSLTLGRSSASDVPLSDRTLSRSHARVDLGPGGPSLADLGSRNGTQLNGVRIQGPTPLRPGDRIVIGETTIDVTEEAATRVTIGGGPGEGVPDRTLLSTATALETLRPDTATPGLGTEELARLNAQLRILNDVSVALLGETPLGELLELILQKVFAHLSPDRGLLMLADVSGALVPAATRFAEGMADTDIRLSRTLVHAVMEQKSGVLMIDTAGDEKLATADSIRLQGITSVLAAPLFVEYLVPRLGQAPVTVVSPDTGAIKRADALRLRLAAALGRPVDVAFVEKYRSEGTLRGGMLVGDVAGRVAVIVDDLVSAGNTIARAAHACRAHGATSVVACVTHGVFAAEANTVLADAPVEEIVVTDTLPPWRLTEPRVLDRLRRVSTVPLVADAIRRLHEGGSLVALAEG